MPTPRRTKEEDHIPILGIEAFQQGPQTEGKFLYHELFGERRFDKPHKHDFFLFLLFEKGAGTHTIDFVDHVTADKQVHLLFPDQVHRWDFGKKTKAYQLMISRPVFETFAASLPFSLVFFQNRSVINLSPATFQKLLYEFRSIQQELAIKPVQWDIVNLRSKLIAQLVSREAEEKLGETMSYRSKPVLLKFLSLIDNYYKEQKSVVFYAGQLNISANYLNILCKRHFNTTATFLIQSRVTLEAKRLIQASEKSIKEIAYELGFNDLAYFSNFFKSQTGIAPREFREQL